MIGEYDSLWTETENTGSWGSFDVFQDAYLNTNYGLAVAILYDKLVL